jgi:hypothetical protein
VSRSKHHRGPYLKPVQKNYVTLGYEREEAELKRERQVMRRDDERIESYKKRLWIDPDTAI